MILTEKNNNFLTRVVVCTLFLVLLTPSIVLFSETISLNLEQAVVRALDSNLDLQKEKYTLKKLKIARSSSWNVIIPTISIGGSLSKQNTETSTNPNGLSSEDWFRRQQINVSTPLGGRLGMSIIDSIIPYKEYELGKITEEQLLTTTSVNVQKAYIKLYITQQQMLLLSEKLATQKLKESDSALSYNSGLLNEYNYLQTQFSVIKSQQAYDLQNNVLKNSNEQFALLLGYPIDTEFELQDEISQVDTDIVDTWLGVNKITQNYTMQSIVIREKILKLNCLKGLFGFIPQFSLSWNMAYVFKEDPISWFDDNWGDDLGSLSFSLSIPLSEYHPWSRSGVLLRRLLQDIEINKIDYIQVQESVEQQLIAKKRLLQQAADALSIQETQIEITKRAFELADEAYQQGLMSIVEYQEAQDNLYNAQIDYLSFQADIIQNILNITVLTGEMKSIL